VFFVGLLLRGVNRGGPEVSEVVDLLLLRGLELVVLLVAFGLGPRGLGLEGLFLVVHALEGVGLFNGLFNGLFDGHFEGGFEVLLDGQGLLLVVLLLGHVRELVRGGGWLRETSFLTIHLERVVLH